MSATATETRKVKTPPTKPQRKPALAAPQTNACLVQLTGRLDETLHGTEPGIEQFDEEWLLVGGDDLRAKAVAALNAMALSFADDYAKRLRAAARPA